MTAPRSGPLVLSTRPAEAWDRRLALGVAAISAALFLALVPFAKTPLGPAPTFIPIYQTALIVKRHRHGDAVIRAVARDAYACAPRARVRLIFTALTAFAHMLTFPGAFAATGLLGAGEQSTAYLFVFLHTGFPLFVMAYAVLKQRPPPAASWSPPVLPALIGVALLVVALATLATAGNDLLPRMLNGNQYASSFHVARFCQWFVTAVAIFVLWRRKPHSVLDLWVLVALSA